MKPPPRKYLGSPDRPALNYYGGKWILAPWTISLMPSHRGYCEPFGGAASVILRKDRVHTEIYNDLDGDVVNLFRVLRDMGNDLSRVIRDTPMARDEFDLSYLPCEDPLEQARRMVVRSFFGFGGVSTHGRSASFIPGTRIDCRKSPAESWITMPESLLKISERFRGVVIENRDAVEVIKRYDSKEMFFYVDPPYVSSTRGVKSVYKFEMDDVAQVSLAKVLNEVEGMVMVAGYRSEIYDNIYDGWRVEERKTLDQRSNERIECLWMRNIESSQRMLL